THHAAETALGIGDEQTTGCWGLGAGGWGRPGGGGLGAGWPERGKIVVERECRRVLRIADAVRARVPRTQVTRWIVGDGRCRRRSFDLSLPRPLVALRRHDHPLVAQRVIPPVRVIGHRDKTLSCS